eukprot:403357047
MQKSSQSDQSIKKNKNKKSDSKIQIIRIERKNYKPWILAIATLAIVYLVFTFQTQPSAKQNKPVNFLDSDNQDSDSNVSLIPQSNLSDFQNEQQFQGDYHKNNDVQIKIKNTTTDFDDDLKQKLQRNLQQLSSADEFNYGEGNLIQDANVSIDLNLRTSFVNYLAKFKKSYTSLSEYNKRLSNFDNTKRFIDEKNNQILNFKLELNRYADWSDYEIRNFLILRPPRQIVNAKFNINPDLKKVTIVNSSISTLSGQLRSPLVKFLPTNFNWNERGRDSPVKDQGICGSCYAFSALSQLESLLMIQNITKYRNIDLSEQQIVDCTYSDQFNRGCMGGHMVYTFQYLQSTKILEEKDYMYTQQLSECKISKDQAQTRGVTLVKEYQNMQNMDPEEMKWLVYKQPISASISAYSHTFLSYSSGILDSEECGSELTHAVTIVGWGQEQGIQYWIVKNSWGSSWGEKGYIRIAITYGDGICGINKDVTFVSI